MSDRDFPTMTVATRPGNESLLPESPSLLGSVCDPNNIRRESATAGPSTSNPTGTTDAATASVSDLGPPGSGIGRSGLIVARASEVQPAPVRWLWPGIIARGKITGLVDHPGLGKSQVAMDCAARVSTGHPWPGDVKNEAVGDVIILSAEDDAADALVPRAIAAEADRSRVHLVRAVKDDGVERAFNLGLDLGRIEKEFDLAKVRLLIIDPTNAYLGFSKAATFDRNHGGDVRSVLGRLAVFSACHDLAVLAVSHLNKSGGARAITRVMGSQEWVAAPRAVFLVEKELGTSRRLFLPLKNNLAPDRTGYAFELVGRQVEGVSTSAVVWSSEPVTMSADEALTAAGKKVTSGAVDFVQEALRDGPMDQAEIVRRGKEAGFTERTSVPHEKSWGSNLEKKALGRPESRFGGRLMARPRSAWRRTTRRSRKPRPRAKIVKMAAAIRMGAGVDEQPEGPQDGQDEGMETLTKVGPA
jgi:putative DNA primase/helicase